MDGKTVNHEDGLNGYAADLERSDDHNLGMLVHLLGMIGLIEPMLLGFIATLVMWLMTRKNSEFVDDHGKEALNFQISVFIYMMVGGVLVGLGILLTLGIGVIILLPLFILFGLVLWVVRLVSGIKAAMAANRGEFYRYPICIRFLQ